VGFYWVTGSRGLSNAAVVRIGSRRLGGEGLSYFLVFKCFYRGPEKGKGEKVCRAACGMVAVKKPK